MLHNQIKIGKKVFTVKGEYLNWLRHYKLNKSTKVGSQITCVVCQTKIEKTKPPYVFCGMVCKDDFWNKIDPRKRNNNGRNRGQKHYVTKHWCDDDLADCDYHNKY